MMIGEFSQDGRVVFYEPKRNSKTPISIDHAKKIQTLTADLADIIREVNPVSVKEWSAFESLVNAHKDMAKIDTGEFMQLPMDMGDKPKKEGKPRKDWVQYLEAERITGIPGYLYILQLNERKILEGSLKIICIGSVEMTEHYPPSGPQIFFDVFRFNWYNLDTLEPGQLNYPIPEPLPPKIIRPWERKRKFPKYRQQTLEEINAKSNCNAPA